MKFAKSNNEKQIHIVPVISIRQLTDEEWNRIAYRNMLERQVRANATAQAVH